MSPAMANLGLSDLAAHIFVYLLVLGPANILAQLPTQLRDDDNDDDGEDSNNSSCFSHTSHRPTSTSHLGCSSTSSIASSGSHHGPSKGAIAGIVIGILIFVLILLLLLFCWRKRLRQTQSHTHLIVADKPLPPSPVPRSVMITPGNPTSLPPGLIAHSYSDSTRAQADHASYVGFPVTERLLGEGNQNARNDTYYDPSPLNRSLSTHTLPNPYDSFVFHDASSLPSNSAQPAAQSPPPRLTASIGASESAAPSSFSGFNENLSTSTAPSSLSYAALSHSAPTPDLNIAGTSAAGGRTLFDELAGYQKVLETHHKKESADGTLIGGSQAVDLQLDPPPVYRIREGADSNEVLPQSNAF